MTSQKMIDARRARENWPTQSQILENQTVLHWDKFSRDRRGALKIVVTCGRCKEEREVFANKTRSERYIGFCKSCNGQTIHLHSTGPDHPAWKDGVFIANGYRYIQLAILTGRKLEIAEQMTRKFGNGTHVVAEHRLVVAVNLDRPLLRTEVVHHRNGNKLDNSIENLEITTGADHRKLDVKYYRLWCAATVRIKELEQEIKELRGRLNSP